MLIVDQHWGSHSHAYQYYCGGSSGFAEQRNLKKIRRGIRNFSNFFAERRNSSSPFEADFLKMISGMLDYYEILSICGSFMLSCRKMSWSHLCFSSQLYENNFQALHKNFN